MRVMHVLHVRVPMSRWLVLVRMRMRLAVPLSGRSNYVAKSVSK